MHHEHNYYIIRYHKNFCVAEKYWLQKKCSEYNMNITTTIPIYHYNAKNFCVAENILVTEKIDLKRLHKLKFS